MSETANPAPSAEIAEQTRRDFLFTTTGAVGAVGVAVAAWACIAQMANSECV